MKGDFIMENKNAKFVEAEDLNVEVTESKLETIASKAKTGVNKYGKKVLAIAGLGIVGALGYVLGVKVGRNGSKNDDAEIDSEEECVDYSDELE